MSSDRQRLVGAIRRIANIDQDDGSGQRESSNRGSQPGSVGYGVTESIERLCCDGSVSGNANPGTNTRDPSEDTQDGLNPDDPADISGGLTGVTDCDTGDPVCFDGSGWVPPDGWESPADPPVDPTYTVGKYWRAHDGSGGNEGFGATKQAAIDATGVARSDCITCNGNELLGVPTTQTSDTCDDSNLVIRCGGSNYYGFESYDVNQHDCSGGHESEPYCNPSEEDTLLDSWPTDGCVNLAIIDGRIVGSKYDPENDGSYNAPRDEMPLCDAVTGEQILIRGSAGGGWKSIKGLAGDIDPDTDHGYLYSAYGDVIRQISPSEFRDDRV